MWQEFFGRMGLQDWTERPLPSGIFMSPALHCMVDNKDKVTNLTIMTINLTLQTFFMKACLRELIRTFQDRLKKKKSSI